MFVFYGALIKSRVHEVFCALQDRRGVVHGPRVKLHYDGESLAKLVLQMLSAAQTPELAVNHDGEAVAKGFALLHAERIFE